MQFNELLAFLVGRRSCRQFLDKDVPDELVRKVMYAGLWCPSAHNKQGSIIVRVKDPELKEKIRRSTSFIMTNKEDFDPFYGAPEVLVVMRNEFEDSSLAFMDGSLVMYNMILAAESLGLGSCWVNTAQYNHTFIDSVIPEINERLCLVDSENLKYDPDETAKKACFNDGHCRMLGVAYLALGFKGDTTDSTPLERKPKRIFQI